MQSVTSNAHEIETLVQGNTVRESAFYPELKAASENGNQSTFGLILSMLSQDATELDQFHQPMTKPLQNKRDFYKQFNIQQQQLQGDSNTTRLSELASMFRDDFKRSAELDLLIKPEPLIQSKRNVIADDVLNNLDINVKARLYKQQEVNVQEQAKDKIAIKEKAENEVDVESWFQVLEQARTFSMMA